MDERLDPPQGTLDLLILKALALEPLHGWAISERIQQVSREAIQIPQGSLYPALHRLERKGLGGHPKAAIRTGIAVCAAYLISGSAPDDVGQLVCLLLSRTSPQLALAVLAPFRLRGAGDLLC